MRSAEIDPLIERLRSFEDLQLGWCYGQGGPIGNAVTSDALRIYELLRAHRLTRVEAFPYVSGEVMVSAVNGAWSVELLCDGSHNYGVTIEHHDEDKIRVIELNIQQVIRLLASVPWPSTKSYGYFIHDTTAMRKEDLQVQHSPYRLMASQSLNLPALSKKVEPNANTYRSSTQAA